MAMIRSVIHDISMGAIQMSLTVVKEESALASKVPYIAPIAGILLEAIMMHNDEQHVLTSGEVTGLS